MLAMALTLLLAPNPPDTNSRNGQWLLSLCAEYDGSDASLAKALPCMSYVAGVADTIGNYEGMLAVTQALDNLLHMNLAAHLGLVPKETIDRLAASPSTAALAARFSKLQRQTGTTRLAPDLEGKTSVPCIRPHNAWTATLRDNGGNVPRGNPNLAQVLRPLDARDSPVNPTPPAL